MKCKAFDSVTFIIMVIIITSTITPVLNIILFESINSMRRHSDFLFSAASIENSSCVNPCCDEYQPDSPVTAGQSHEDTVYFFIHHCRRHVPENTQTRAVIRGAFFKMQKTKTLKLYSAKKKKQQKQQIVFEHRFFVRKRKYMQRTNNRRSEAI